MLLVFLLVILMFTLFWILLRKPSDYPPGPWGLPLIGWPPSSLEQFNKKLLKFREEKHDIIGWRIGTRFVVSILDYDLLKEVFHHPDIAFRPDVNSLTNIRGTKTLGFIHSGGVQYRQNKRLALRRLRDFGMGKEKQLFDAHFEAKNFVNDLMKRVGTPTSMPQSLFICILNNIWKMVGNISYKYDDRDVIDFIELMSATRVYANRIIIMDVFPWMQSILPTVLLNKLFKFEILDKLSEKYLYYFKESIYQHMKNFNKEDVKDYIDSYLLEKEKRKDELESLMSIDNLAFCLSDLFLGATETTGHTIHWSILYLAKYQNVQVQLQEEIDRVLPKGTLFQMKDKIKLPYTEAFIHEILRTTTVANSPPRAAIEDTKIGPYVIPKGALILGRTSMIHHDSKYWDFPYEFRPERFLDSNGKFVAPTKGFAPFGLGRRTCIGETIARMQLFVYITKLAQNFQFDCPPGEKITLEDNTSLFFRAPKGSPKFVIKPR